MARYESVLDSIGNTPLVDISELSPNPRVSILLKLEGVNPAGSVKDRAAKSMVEEAEKDGSLRHGQRILESSSGNTAAGLALIARVKGYPFTVVVPENVSTERAKLLAAFGAQIIPSPAAEGSNGAMRRAQALAEQHPEWWFAFQYGNPANPKAHYEGTGPEIWRDCPEVTHFVAGLGTGGTIIGVGRFLKERNPDVRIWAIQPPAGEKVEGLKSLDEGFVPPVFIDGDGYSLLDRSRVVGPRESIKWARRLAEAGIFAGISTGAAMAGVARCASEIDEGTIVTVSPDGGWKYLSTDVWTGDLDEAAERARHELYF
ncbi:MAG TPA: cysteine synthase family protein [Acidimicrobiales bacterium]|nr:cysteine synthase family protein [Acidimicrobiales bacterium]